MSLLELPENHAVAAALRACSLPEAEGLSAADAVTAIHWHGDKLSLEFMFGYPIVSQEDQLRKRLMEQLSSITSDVALKLRWQVPAVGSANNKDGIPGVKNIVAIASGKGGVGKSTTTANLALALAAEGARVGVLDADIYGPSQGKMLGVADQRPDMHSPTKMKPIEAIGGLQMISMANLVTEKTPMIWRGPMVSGALQQLLNSTHWHDLDYLLIDMPPGTGDIQLTLSQSVPVTASVIVTTPQDIALLDAKKGIEMFRKVRIPVLGVVENMSTHVCSQCGHEEAIFGHQGGQRLAQEYDVNLLGQMPLQLSIREQTDDGKPPVVAEPEGEIGQRYRAIGRKVAASLWQMSLTGAQAPEISISDD